MKAIGLLDGIVKLRQSLTRACRVALTGRQIFHQQKICTRKKHARNSQPGFCQCAQPQCFGFKESGRGFMVRFQDKIALLCFQPPKLIDITARKARLPVNMPGNFPDLRPVQSFSLSNKAGDLRE